MLRVTPSNSAAQARTYYTQSLSRQDYYTRDTGTEIVGQWHGEGAVRLGLSGDVTRDTFFALCDNVHPQTGAQLTPRMKDNRRVGYDFTFCAPKSVAMLQALTGDARILTVFRDAVDATMRDVERDMKTRVRSKAVHADRATGNMVWADFTHFTTRPVGGVPDMDLHAHCFALNATWDGQEQRWKAGQFGDLKRDAAYFEAAFHARLSVAMKALGYRVERRGKWWDVGGISRDTVEKFSRRTAQIETQAKALGITDAQSKGELGAKTRARKEKSFTMPQLRDLWRARLSDTLRLYFISATVTVVVETGALRLVDFLRRHSVLRLCVSNTVPFNTGVDEVFITSIGIGPPEGEALHEPVN